MIDDNDQNQNNLEKENSKLNKELGMKSDRIKELEDQVLEKAKQAQQYVKEAEELNSKLNSLKDQMLEKDKEIDMLRKKAGDFDQNTIEELKQAKADREKEK